MDEAERTDVNFLVNTFCADTKGEERKKCRGQAMKCVNPETKSKYAKGVRCPKKMKDAIGLTGMPDVSESFDFDSDDMEMGEW